MGGYETYSYYGWMGAIMYNVGYHNEHHDFPNIPGSRLYKVKAAAPEFYDNLPYHTSWWKVYYEYLTRPDINPHTQPHLFGNIYLLWFFCSSGPLTCFFFCGRGSLR